ncbi:ester cyclase [Candidatus Poribacteria bacterium]|nr:ester cyclase [Candidatus Poribacteria bacterium]
MFSRISNTFIGSPKFYLGLSIILIAFGGVINATADTEANKAIVSSAFEEILNQKNLALVDEFYATDYIFHLAGNPDIHGSEGLKQFFAMYLAAFPDIHFTIDDIVAEGDEVVIRDTVRSTHQGEFVGIPSTGNQVTFTGMFAHRVVEGKIMESWGEGDFLALMQQFGVIPAMGRETFTWGEPSVVTGNPGDPETNKATVQRMIAEVWNQGKLSVVDEVFDADYILHDPAWPMEVRGPEGFKQYVAAMLGPFPDTYFTIEDIIAEGDKVAVRYTALGTHQGEFMSIPPTGKQITITGITIHRFADGKFVESWFSYDMLGFMQQLTAPPPVPEDYTNVFFTSLSPGLNMVSLPLKPQTPYTARSFAEELYSTVVIKLDEKRQRFVGFTLDAPDDGFTIEGGKGYIVNVPEGRVVAFTGAAWTNQPLTEAAPAAQSDGAWAFVVSGRFGDDSDNRLTKDGYLVTVRNTRTNAVAIAVVREGYFAAAFANLSRENVVQIGDRLEVQVQDRTGEIASETLTYTVKAESIRQAFLSVTLKDVLKPRHSMLIGMD